MGSQVGATARAARSQQGGTQTQSLKDNNAAKLFQELMELANKAQIASVMKSAQGDKKETYWERRMRLFKENLELANQAAEKRRELEKARPMVHYELDEEGNLVKYEDVASADLFKSMFS